MRDDPKQAAMATRLIEGLTSEQPGFLPLVSIVELVWVLSSNYGLERDNTAEALDLLLRSKELIVDRAELVLQAQRRFAQGGTDFADCLTESIAHAQRSETTTFTPMASGKRFQRNRSRLGFVDRRSWP